MGSSLKWQVPIAAIGFIIVAVVLASATSSTPQRTLELPAAGGTYVEGVVGQPKYINPILSHLNPVDVDLSALVFSGLMKVAEDGTVVADLAEKWEISEDGKVYVFQLRKDIEWHDGFPFVADDVVFTVRAIQDPSYQGNPAMAELWKNVAVDKMSDTQVRFTLKDAYAPFLENATLGLLPSHVVGNISSKDLAGVRFNVLPVGTGPYRVLESSLKEVVLENNPDYYGEKPLLNRLRFRFYPDAKAALAALRIDEVQGVGYLGAEEASALRTDKRLSLYSAPEFSKLTLLILNTKSPVFGEKAVRQAVAYAIDRQQLIEVAAGGQAVKADSPVMPLSWAYNRDIKKYEYRPAEAVRLLDSAGWRDADGDGIREKENQKLSFILLTNDKPQRIKAAEEISRQLIAIGMKVEVQAAGWSGFVQDFLVPRFFHAVLAEQWSPNFDPDSYQFWHSSQARQGGLNFAMWTSRQADELLENARRNTNLAERAKLYRDFQTLFAEEQPGILLYFPVFNYAVDRNVKGVRLGTLADPSHRFDHIAEWYLRTKRVVVDEQGRSKEQ
ncbi:MAG: peptide ABC transporter substrate-binding protein [Chloroflexi bacterium]|nr:peptide ABC transporter substrate-binding protein [Chloroflexota bacterium]